MRDSSAAGDTDSIMSSGKADTDEVEDEKRPVLPATNQAAEVGHLFWF